MDDDARLLALAKAGNPQAFAALVERHQRDLRAFVASRVGVLGPVDEIAAEAFTRGWLGLGTFEKAESFGSWVKGIARLVLMERSRENGKAAARRAAPPHGRAHETQPDDRLLRAVDELPEALREIVALRFFAGLSCTQVAERLDVPVGTVTKRLSRAYAELRRSLGAGPGVEPGGPAPNAAAKHQEITR